MNNREGHIFITVPGTGVLSIYLSDCDYHRYLFCHLTRVIWRDCLSGFQCGDRSHDIWADYADLLF